MTTDDLIVTRDGPAAVLRMNRPDRLNALSVPMLIAMREAVRAAVADDGVAGIVITGTGRAFCAGIDTAALMEAATGGAVDGTDGATGDAEAGLPALFSYLLSAPKPVIAAVNGVAAGGGFVLAMMSDLRFVGAGASFTTIFAKRGLIAEHGTSFLLPRMIGTGRALDLLWSSRKVDAEEALRLGFADRVVPDDALLPTAVAYLADLAANVAPRAIATIKRQVYAHLSQPMTVALNEADALMRAALQHPDAKEGVDSFLERRSPRFAPIGGGGDG